MSIEVKNLSFSYGDRPVLHDISFKVEKGEFLSILGPNGVGKSTLFRCVLGLLSGYTGQVLVDGIDSRSFSVREAAKHIAYIPSPAIPFLITAFLISYSWGEPAVCPPSAAPKRRIWKLAIGHWIKLVSPISPIGASTGFPAASSSWC